MRTQVVGKTSMMSSSSRPSRVHFVLLMSIMMMLMLFNNSTCQACNICGCDGCIMANVQANVTFFHNNHTKQLSCGALQDKANDVDGVGGFDEEFCQTEIVSKAWEKCGCYNKFGQLLTDYYAQTIPPVGTYVFRLLPFLSYVQTICLLFVCC